MSRFVYEIAAEPIPFLVYQQYEQLKGRLGWGNIPYYTDENPNSPVEDNWICIARCELNDNGRLYTSYLLVERR